MEHNRKLIASDYDGTFYLNEEGIKINIEKVNKFRENNNFFVMATGNNFKNFKEVISEYSIQYDYLILDQGASIFDNQNNLLKTCFLDYGISKRIIDEILLTHKEYQLYMPYGETETIEEKNITKMKIDFINLKEAFDFTNKINKEFGEYVNAYVMIFKEINIVEIISSKTDKNEAIKYLVDKENISNENVYTIGDGYNDISMIQNFNGYCMKNSVEELLQKCKRQVGSVAELIDKVVEA